MGQAVTLAHEITPNHNRFLKSLGRSPVLCLAPVSEKLKKPTQLVLELKQIKAVQGGDNRGFMGNCMEFRL